jgi:serine/threonine protein kinase
VNQFAGKHPLVVELRSPTEMTERFSIATAYAWHGSLARHHPPIARLRGPNRTAKVVAGIALAMRFVHSRGAIHRDLRPENILLECDWSVRIADFGHSTTADPTALAPSMGSRYLAPECYDGAFLPASDVFAFALILFEIVADRPAFPEDLRLAQIAYMVANEGHRPEIPDSVPPRTRELIEECWAADPNDRPTFEEIVEWLVKIQFKVIKRANSRKIAEFVKQIEIWERLHRDN